MPPSAFNAARPQERCGNGAARIPPEEPVQLGAAGALPNRGSLNWCWRAVRKASKAAGTRRA